MSALKLNAVQIGQSVTATNNFTFYQPTTPDGSVRIGNGNAGAATDKVTIQSSGDVGVTGGITAGNGITAVDGTGLVQAGTLQSFGDTTVGGDVSATSYHGGQLAGMRNKIINGDMVIAQRGTSTAAAPTNTFTVDRFKCQYGGTTAVVTTSQQADNPTPEFSYTSRIAVTTADAAVAATDYMMLSQAIEGYNVRDLIDKTFTLSFWVKSSKTGAHSVSFQTSTSDRSYLSEYTISTANTWEFKTITVTGGLNNSSGTWNWTNGAGLRLCWTLMSGTTYQNATANSWLTGNYIATTNQVNCLDTIGNIFGLTGVQLEVGSVATPFEHRPYGMELALCQRYCFAGRLYVPAGTIQNVPLPVTMRTNMGAAVITGTGVGFALADTNPTSVLIATQTGASGQNIIVTTEL